MAARRKGEASAPPKPKQHLVNLTDRQQSVINNHVRAIQDLDGKLYVYTRGIADSNDVPEEFTFVGINDKGEGVFREVQSGPQPA